MKIHVTGLAGILIYLSLAVTLNAYNNKTSAKDTIQSDNIILYYTIAASTAYAAGEMLVLPAMWYKDRQRVPFHFFNDNSGFLQVDKFGHAFGSYFESYIAYHWLKNSGVNKTQALIFGGALGIILQTPIEIMDGLYEGWGFSWGDMAANTFGSALVIGQELIFNEQLIKFKFSYWGSRYADMSNGYYGHTTLNRLLKDYNGHTYWFSMPLNRIISNEQIPDWLNIAFGYSANGMLGEFDNMNSYNGAALPQTERYRQYLFSLDIDWTKIKSSSKFLNTLLDILTFIKLPFPALEFNSKGKFEGYGLYF